MKQGKVWGMTELICANHALEFHRIDFKKGGVCSKHKHKFKWNGFYVVSGKLLIRNWRHCQDLLDETILGPGEFNAVEPDIIISLKHLKMVLPLRYTGQSLTIMILKENISDLIEI